MKDDDDGMGLSVRNDQIHKFLLDSAGPDPAHTTHARTHASRSQFGFQDISHICSDLGSDVSTLLPMAGVNRTKRGIRVEWKEGRGGVSGEKEKKERKERVR